MSAGLDVLNRNTGDVRKVHARELATNVVVALFRLVKLSTLHSLDNQAMIRQVEETTQAVHEYGARTEHNVSILFTHGSVFVGGQLLRANRGVYEGALELGTILSRVGAAEIGIRREAQSGDYLALASALADALRKPKPPRIERPTPNIRLRGIAASALLREDLGAERVDPTVQVSRTYASAVVIMRRFFEDLRRGKYDLPQRVKRVAQRLVDLSMGETPAFLGVTAARNQNHDEAGRAVNTAILALAMTRQVTEDVVQLSRLAMAALLYDCARARISGVVGMPAGGIVPQYSEQQENEAAAGTAVVLTALGRINEPSVMRTVISYEAHWERRRARLGPVYRGLRAASLQARIVNIARAFNDLLTPAPGQNAPTADETIAKLEQETNDAADRTVIRLLIGALGIFTTGTIVKLNTGETGIVVQTPTHPSLYSQPRVRLVLDARGGWLQPAVELDLAHQRGPERETRHIKEVVATSDDPAGAQMRAYASGPVASSRAEAAMNPPSGQSGLRSGAQSYPAGPSSQQINPPSYQVTPPSFQVRTPSSLRVPRTGEAATGASRPTIAPSGRQRSITLSGDVGPDSPAPPAARAPRMPNVAPYIDANENPYADGYDEGYPPSAPISSPLSSHDRYAAPLLEPLRPGRSTTLQTPVFEQDPRSLPAPPMSGQPVYELEEQDPHDDADLLVEDEGVSTRAVSPEEHAHLLAAAAPQPARARQAPAARAGSAPAVVEPEPEPEKPAELAPTAEGLIQKTPFVNLLIYMLDQRLTGTTVFRLANGVEHAVYFHDGAAAKVRTGTMLQPLDRVLVDLGLLDDASLRGTMMEISKKAVLHGRLLVMKGLLDREKVMHALRVQVERKVTSLFDLPGDTRYAYYADANLIASYGGPELLPTEPLGVIMSGIRLMSDPLIDATLARITGRQLALHLDAETKRMGLHRDELGVVDLIRAQRMSLEALLAGGVAQDRVVRRVVYALVVTRQVDLGSGRPPVGFGRPIVTDEVLRQPDGPEPNVAPSSREAPSQAAKEAVKPAAPIASVAPAPPARPAAPPARPAPPPPPLARAKAADVGPPSSQQTPAPATPLSAVATNAAPSVRPVEAAAPPPAPVRTAPARRPAPPPPPRPAHVQAAQASAAQASPADAIPLAMPLPSVEAPKPARTPIAAPAAPIAGRPIASAPIAAPIAASSSKSNERRAEIERRERSIDGEDYYEMLGVARDAAPEQIRGAYFALAKTWHPDRLPSDMMDVKPTVARIFARFSEAYQTLSDPLKAKGYAEVIKSGGSGSQQEQDQVARVVEAALEFQKAEILLKKNDLAGAEQLVAGAVAADPDQPEYAALLMWVRALRRGDPPEIREGQTSTHFDDLLRVLDGILAKEQRFERALYYRGVLLKRSGRVEKAIRDFRLAAEINPKNLDAVREVRLYEMRKRGGAPAPAKDKPADGQQDGLFGKLFKR